jgi:transposase
MIFTGRPFDGPFHRDAFTADVDQSLVAELTTGDIIITANPSRERAPAIREAIEAPGGKLRFPPLCRSDFNPVETASSMLNAPLREPAPSSPSTASGPSSAASSPSPQPQQCSNYFSFCRNNSR